MAKIKSSFQCMVCSEVLNFPNNVDIVDFTVLFLQFYKGHDRCEKLAEQLSKKEESPDANRPAES